jgi:hypothetical protein
MSNKPIRFQKPYRFGLLPLRLLSHESVAYAAVLTENIVTKKIVDIKKKQWQINLVSHSLGKEL